MPDDPIPPVPPSGGWKPGDKEPNPKPDKGDEQEEKKSA